MQPSDLTQEELALLQSASLEPDGQSEGEGPTSWDQDELPSIDMRRQLEVLETFHQDVASRFADALSRGLQRLVEVQLVRVEAMLYSQFAFSRQNPTCYAVLQATPLAAPLAMDVGPALLYPILDCLLGGGKQPCPVPDRAPTELEQRLARRVIGMLLDELHEAWEPLLAVDFSIDRIESHAQRVRVVAPGDEVISIVFQAVVADQTGELALCLPQQAIQQILDKLLVGEFHAETTGMNSLTGHSEVVELVAKFDAESISPVELEQLRPGDVLLSDVDIDAPVDLVIDDRVILQGKPGAVQGRRAIVLVG